MKSVPLIISRSKRLQRRTCSRIIVFVAVNSIGSTSIQVKRDSSQEGKIRIEVADGSGKDLWEIPICGVQGY
jgi:hypothetical protein